MGFDFQIHAGAEEGADDMVLLLVELDHQPKPSCLDAKKAHALRFETVVTEETHGKFHVEQEPALDTHFDVEPWHCQLHLLLCQ